MLPMKAVRLQFGELLAIDAGSLADADAANRIMLVIEEFALDETAVFADLTEATFTGSAAIAGATGAQQVGIDPVTGQQVITIKEPVGGWRWECTVAPDPVQTVVGYALVNNEKTVLLGLALLPVPITISEVGQEINLGKVQIRLLQQPTTGD